MKTCNRSIRRLMITCLLGVFVFTSFTEPSLSQIGIGIGGGSRNDGDGINIDIFQLGKTVKSAAEAKRGFTYEQEYYLGRAIAANILSQYTVYNDTAATQYVALLGQTLAAHSDMPQTFGGYRFILLDSDEINAFATPGGIIFVTRGMLQACENEDQLAAVLAHEIAHVQSRHGIEMIKDSRWKKFGTEAVFLAASGFGGGDVGAAVGVFGDMAKDISKEIMTRGYGKKLEKLADTEALTILMRVGYEPHESITLMQNMQDNFVRGKKDFAKTHPKPKDRIKTIGKVLKGGQEAAPIPPVRVSRFDTALSQARAQ
jgi:predicted Zn-dependent protease